MDTLNDTTIENLVRLVATIAPFALSILAARRKWFAKVLVKAAAMVENGQEPKANGGSSGGNGNGAIAATTAQNLTLAAFAENLKAIRTDMDEMGVDIRRQMDSLLMQISNERRERASVVEEMKTGLNSLSLRLLALEKSLNGSDETGAPGSG